MIENAEKCGVARLRAQRQALRLRNLDKFRAQEKASRSRNRDKILARKKAARLRNRDKLLVKSRARYWSMPGREQAKVIRVAVQQRKAFEQQERILEKIERQKRILFYKAELFASRECKECQQSFVPARLNQRSCSVICAKRYDRRVEKRVRRARKRGVEYEAINPLKIFERDGWRCQLCRCSTSRRFVGQMRDNAPEMDHIVPLALGGPHVYSNVQLLCRQCNWKKGAKVLGQLRLAV